MSAKGYSSAQGVPPKIASYGGTGELRHWLRVVAMRTALNLGRGVDPVELDADRLLSQVDTSDDPSLDYFKRGLPLTNPGTASRGSRRGAHLPRPKPRPLHDRTRTRRRRHRSDLPRAPHHRDLLAVNLEKASPDGRPDDDDAAASRESVRIREHSAPHS